MHFPRVFIEVTNICNLSCLYCPSSIQKRKKQFMDFELFKKIIDDLFTDHVTMSINFHIMGEPLLNKEFFDMVTYLCCREKYPVNLSITTNGILLKNDSIQEAILNSNLDKVMISIRAQDEKEYTIKANKNVMPEYENYIQSIKSFIRKVHEKDTNLLISLGYFHSVNSPYTLVSSHPFITKKSQIKKLVKYWHESIKNYKQAIPIKKVTIPFSLKSGLNYEKNVQLSKNLELIIDEMGIWHNRLCPDDYFIEDTFYGKCRFSENLNITSDGDVIGCYIDFDGDINFGNLRHSSINDIISSEKYVDFRKNMDKGILISSVCRRCQGKICEKASGKELKFKPSKLISYYYHSVARVSQFLKIVWNNL